MKVFLSWSGTRSKFIAEALRWWLPRVIQSVRPWMSDEDISAGSRWLSNVSSELSEAKLGIICVTPENQNNPWLLFEAGALSKVIDQAHVCPFLIDLTPGQLAGPLSQFQANQVSFEGTSKIVFALNRLLGPAQIPDADLEEIFAVWWPKLDEKVKNAPNVVDTTPKRTNEDILEEIISNTREQILREILRTALQRDENTKLDQMTETMQRNMLTFQKFSTVIDNIIAKTAMKTPEEIAIIMQAMKPPSLSDMQQIIASAKGAAESHRAFANDILKNEKADDPDKAPLHE